MGRKESNRFEDEARRLVNDIYGIPNIGANPTVLDGRERDGVIIGQHVVVALEATRDSRVEKARKDGAKLLELCRKLRQEHRTKPVLGLFVTQATPTADQADVILALGDPNIRATSIMDLRRELIDSTEYLRLRENHSFGSAVDPDREAPDAPDLFSTEYVDLDFTDVGKDSDLESRNVHFIVDSLSRGKYVLLTGAFGAGKSMTAREAHRILSAFHKDDPTLPFPVTLNLREHKGQSDPAEAFQRHCNNIGFPNHAQLFAAWKSGYVHLILDGFDEISGQSWTSSMGDLKRLRRSSMELVRNFVRDHNSSLPKSQKDSSGLFVLGRQNVFDSHEELLETLGLNEKDAGGLVSLRTDEFTDEQVDQYLKRRDMHSQLPDWFPRRPLLLGYLASKRFLETRDNEIFNATPAAGWHYLLDRIAERESRLEDNFPPSQVREVMERVATIARLRGYVEQADLSRVYSEITGLHPSGSIFEVLQRLPGLGASDSLDGRRQFVDHDLAAAAMAGDIVRGLIDNQFNSNLFEIGMEAAPDLTIQVVHFRVTSSMLDLNAESILDVGRRFGLKDNGGALAYDLLRLSLLFEDHLRQDRSYTVTSQIISEFDLTISNGPLSWLWFDDCVIKQFDIPSSYANEDLPRFQGCEIEHLRSSSTLDDLTEEILFKTEVRKFSSVGLTTSGIMSEDKWTMDQRLALTVLKKVYLQTGSGRKISALTRGLPKDQRSRAAQLVDILIKQDFLLPVRAGNQQLVVSRRGMRPTVVDLVSGKRSLAEFGIS